MKKQRKIRLFGFDWKLIETKDEKEEQGGSFTWKTKTIKINDLYGENKMILLHEVLEAIMVHNLVRFYGQEKAIEYQFYFNHTQFSKIVFDLAQTMMDNKDIFL